MHSISVISENPMFVKLVLLVISFFILPQSYLVILLLFAFIAL
jgi:hypothetical protein